MKKKLKILMAAAEAAPFAKVGGLADVVGSLPSAVRRLGCDVRVILPLYGAIDRKKFGLKKIVENFNIHSAGKIEKINIWQAKFPDSQVSAYFLESRYFQTKEIYKPEENYAEGFLFFSLAVLEVLPILKFQPDIIHCHDFHTALITDLLKTEYYQNLQPVKTIYTIHNLNYQGASQIAILQTGNLTKESLASLSRDAQDGDINFMVQGILGADAVTTVSQKYAQEIKTFDFGAGIEKVIQQKKIYGILNGLDLKLFNPVTDKLIAKNYSIKSLKNKTLNKLFLQKELGFAVNERMPLVGMVTRVGWQKGFDLFTDKLFKLPCQFVILGTGEKFYEDKLIALAKKYPEKLKYKNYFDLRLAQQIYAGSDIFLMPSRFEPCGLGQMIAMRYGTVPVVRATGGLDDTVNSKVGFKFKEFTESALLLAMNKGLKVYQNKDKWRKMQTDGMRRDFSWEKSAKEYLKLYEKLLN
jgi:starch synthase